MKIVFILQFLITYVKLILDTINILIQFFFNSIFFSLFNNTNNPQKSVLKLEFILIFFKLISYPG